MKKVLKWVGFAFGGVIAVVIAAVAFAALTAEKKLQYPDTPYPKIAASKDAEVIARGKYLVYGPAHCAQCHTTDDRTKPELVKTEPLHGGLAFEMGPLGNRYGRNLTSDEATGIGKLTDEQVARVIRTGVLPSGEVSFFMKIAAANPSDEDLVAILSYLRSVEPVSREVPKGEWFLFGKILVKYAFPAFEPRPLEGPKHVPPAPSGEPSVERGEYLAENLMLCVGCHTAFDMSTFQASGPKAGGGTPEASHDPKDSHMEFATPNLTSHPTGVTGKMDEEMFLARMKAGRSIETSIMPWESFQQTTESDLRSVYRYLKSLPPVDHDNGPVYREIGSFKSAKSAS